MKKLITCRAILLLAIICVGILPAEATSPIPDKVPGTKRDPYTMSDPEVLGTWCHKFFQSVSSVKEKWSGYDVSCTFRLTKKGKIKDLRVSKSSGSSKIDKIVLVSLKNNEHVPTRRPLASNEELTVQFFKGDDFRMKWKKNGTLVPIGPFAALPDP